MQGRKNKMHFVMYLEFLSKQDLSKQHTVPKFIIYVKNILHNLILQNKPF